MARRPVTDLRCVPKSLHQSEFAVEDRVWTALIAAGVFLAKADGTPFTFASGRQARLKVDVERLQKDPFHYGVVLGLLAVHDCVYDSDTLAYVPNGMADAADRIKELTGKQVIRMRRPEGAGRHDYVFEDGAKKVIAAARKIVLLEDVSTTGSSAHAAGSMILKANPEADIHSLSILQRDPVDPKYARDMPYHTLCIRDVPDTPEELLSRYGLTAELI